MENASMLAAIFGPVLAIMGLSLLLYPSVWLKLLKYYTENHFRLFGMMMFSLLFGMYVISMYNVWEWNLYLIITVIGWGAFLKGAFYMLLPGDTIKNCMKTCATKGMLTLGGLLWLVAGAALCYYSYMV